MNDGQLERIVREAVSEVIGHKEAAYVPEEDKPYFDSDMESLDLEIRTAAHHALSIVSGVKEDFYRASSFPKGKNRRADDAMQVYNLLVQARDIIRKSQMNSRRW